MKDTQTGKKRPPSEWINVTIPAIVDAQMFERVRQRRQARAPAATPPRRVSSRTLLTGLLKCGTCGAGMTLISGKSGRYKYYKCTNRVNKGGHDCASQNVPMEKLDALVKSHLLNRVFTARHLQTMLGEARKLLRDRKVDDQQVLAKLHEDMRRFDDRLNRLYDALESGIVAQDETFQRRMQQAKAGREGVLVEMAGLRQRQALPIERVLPSQVEAFAKVVRTKLEDQSSTFAKDYLTALVDEIRVTGDTATISGSYGRLLGAVVEKKEDTKQVPSFIPDWRARQDSNPRPPGS